ncbi:hypothetical protein Hanom_Chr04g00362861 [Helianthus anomalus]
MIQQRVLQNPRHNLHLHSLLSIFLIQVVRTIQHQVCSIFLIPNLLSIDSFFLIVVYFIVVHFLVQKADLLVVIRFAQCVLHFQVPKGWDKLSMSLISVETGKAIGKTGRSLVHNGNYQWTENQSVYIWVPHDDASTGHEQSLHKLLILMGSGRSGILGEVTVNLSSHMSSGTSTTVAEPLKNCSYGTILLVSHYKMI